MGNFSHKTARLLALLLVGCIFPALFAYQVRDPVLFASYAFVAACAFITTTYIRTSVLTYLWIILGTLVFALAIVDCYALFVLAPRQQVFSGSYATSYFQPDPQLGYTARPSRQYTSTRYDRSSGKIIYRAVYTISELGFRQTIGNQQAPSVVFLGDSAMFGEGLDDDEAIPQIFSDLTGRRFHVMNFGFHGYGPQQSLRMLELGLFDNYIGPHPLLFVLQVHPWLAERTACIPDYSYLGPRYELTSDGSLAYMGACRSRAEYFLERSVKLSPGLKFVEEAIGKRAVNDADFSLFVRIIYQIDQLVKGKYKAHFLVVYLKYGDDEIFQNSSFSNEKILEYFQQHSVAAMNATLSDLLRTGSDNNGLTIPGDGHPSALANRQRAQLIFDWLKDHVDSKSDWSRPSTSN